ncbi:TPM domain-containing protein [Mycobacterium sp. 94-17]|uniref:TPM domain-containing protein n=1 Tax=Mycobacterium sp. 94-17 TaxID=2986147 RepID=UPI002D1ECEB6|nr:TPM domain-containing protein [Mycobacterium sp. 94-17]MEB4211369.1 TPM domain-containing protein [Mycobacterium sp. 94-17]
MRVSRLFGVVLTMLFAALLWAGPAGAQQPTKLTDHITDNTGALTVSSRAVVSSAIDRLYNARRIQLWVVYVDNFSRFKPENWADRTRSASGMGNRDALLAVATNTKAYAFSPPPKALSAGDLNSLQSGQIEPAVGARDWSSAAVAAADGLSKSATPPKRNWLPIAIGAIAAVVVVAVLFALWRARRRRRAKRGQTTSAGDEHSAQRALSTAEARVRQVSDYVARYGSTIGSEAQARLGEARQHLSAAHGAETGNDVDAVAYANRASTLAAQAQSLANADVLKAHRTPRPRGTGSKR